MTQHYHFTGWYDKQRNFKEWLKWGLEEVQDETDI